MNRHTCSAALNLSLALAFAAMATLGCSATSEPATSSTESAVSPVRECAQRRFRYNEVTGRCADETGRRGLNPPDVERFFVKEVPFKDSSYLFARSSFPDGDAECMDFSNFDFTTRMGTRYAALTHWNFRGAKLSGAQFALSAVIDSDLSGADISEFVTGYIYIRATIDAFSRLPTGTAVGVCAVTHDQAVCRN